MTYAAFPAHAGMNRSRKMAFEDLMCVPRTRGDEPHTDDGEANGWLRSPHTRG